MRFFLTAKLHVSSHYGNTFLFFFVVLVFGIDAFTGVHEFQNKLFICFIYRLVPGKFYFPLSVLVSFN